MDFMDVSIVISHCPRHLAQRQVSYHLHIRVAIGSLEQSSRQFSLCIFITAGGISRMPRLDVNKRHHLLRPRTMRRVASVYVRVLTLSEART